MDISEKLNNYINSSETKKDINEKDYEIVASDSARKGKVTIELNHLPMDLQKKVMKSLRDGNFTVDRIVNWIIIDV